MFDSLFSCGQNLSYYNKSSQVAMIFCQYKHTQKEFIEIYQPATKMIWDKPYEVKYIIVVSLKHDIKITDLKLVNKILFYLYYRVKYIQMAFESVDDAYRSCFIEAVTNKDVYKRQVYRYSRIRVSQKGTLTSRPFAMLMRSLRSSSVCMNQLTFRFIISFMRASKGEVPGNLSVSSHVCW